MNFGVSPAWFISLFGEGFTVDQAGGSLKDIKELGFKYWQPEIVLDESLEEWTSGKAEDLRSISDDLGLKARVFVAHFLGPCFSDERALSRRSGIEKLKRVLDALETWTSVEVVSVPLPPFSFDSKGSPDRSSKWMDQLVEKLVAFSTAINATGRRFAIEAMPGNLAGGSAGLAALSRYTGLEGLGFNYDSGHFHAAGESQEMALARLGDKIVCTHLCDNDGKTNLSLAPGDGTISWDQVLQGLLSAGYTKSLDIEIHCPADAVSSAYLRGRKLLERHLLKESA